MTTPTLREIQDPLKQRYRDDPDAARITHYPGGHAEGFAESFLGLVETVYAAIADGRQPADPAFPTFADGVEGLHLEDAVLASHESGRWAPVQRRNA